MLLTGHQAAVYTLKFDPTGLQLASAGADRAIFLWDTRGECENYNVLRGHKNVSAVICHQVWHLLLADTSHKLVLVILLCQRANKDSSCLSLVGDIASDT